jgi:hypothetical protein
VAKHNPEETEEALLDRSMARYKNVGSAALWRACFARAAPHSASLSLLLFLNVSNVRVHLSEVPHFERRQANISTGRMVD